MPPSEAASAIEAALMQGATERSKAPAAGLLIDQAVTSPASIAPPVLSAVYTSNLKAIAAVAKQLPKIHGFSNNWFVGQNRAAALGANRSVMVRPSPPIPLFGSGATCIIRWSREMGVELSLLLGA
jgi:hypothetical protein